MTSNGTPKYHLTIHDFPENERPRERLVVYGEAALSNAELLAILLRVGVAGQNVLTLSTSLLRDFGGVIGLANAGIGELTAVRGISTAKAAQLKAALELGRRLLLASPDFRPQITSPSDAANLLMLEMGALPQENLRTILLDTKNRVLSSPTVYVGNVNSSIIRVAEVFRDAVRSNATAIIVAHNHPSGDPTPSPEDVQVTRSIVQAGQLLGIDVLDHLVIGHQRFVSLKERGLGFD
ncbi:MAG TPA: DNA repair protein RadC [Anaerolineae bacterium]|nr:DNA repair protein RadC [Anaerolineae bacterium]HMR63567.1 DNA repair protein RadC [Anaerolineae bacterium]